MVFHKRVHAPLRILLVLAMTLGMGYSALVDMKRLSTPQVEAMQKLRDLMEREQLEVEPYLWENYSLAKWLHFYSFNVEVTLEALRKNVRWRAEENIDNILKEDWSDMRQRFPYTLATCDKEGRPIQYIDFEHWDVAGYLSGGKPAQDRLLRYMVMWREEAEALVWELFQAGKYVTQGTVIYNLAGFSLQKHATISCLNLYRLIGTVIDPNYPNTRSNVVAVNTPLIFRAVHWAFTPANQNQMVLFGQDRKQWEAALLERIAPDQMPQGLLEDSHPGTPQAPFPENKYTNYVRVQQRSLTPEDTPSPFWFPGMSLTEKGMLRWKRKL